ncbi:C-GCAxxG-C-C family (seleno)protein [Sphaerochaeta sp.]|uniref:C-GCAxxG-C-C family (seleno)protein n=1 Tax=Sphaerochaeta sp. TaxID=1972642 RepID=UPI003D143EBC
MNTCSTISTMVHGQCFLHSPNCSTKTSYHRHSRVLLPCMVVATTGDQCGLVECAVMFIGIYHLERGWEEQDVAKLAYVLAETYRNRFGSLLCKDLRPGGFSEGDSSHLCENLTIGSIAFTYQFICSNCNR